MYAYFLGIYLGPVLMGIALWRSRSVPRWLAVLFFADPAPPSQAMLTAERATIALLTAHNPGPSATPPILASLRPRRPAVGRVTRQRLRAPDFLASRPGGLLNQIPKYCFNDVLPVGAVAMMSARASESAMTAK